MQSSHNIKLPLNYRIQRIYYVEHFDFGKELIQQISIDTGCQKQDIIDEVCKHFQEIKLTPPPKND